MSEEMDIPEGRWEPAAEPLAEAWVEVARRVARYTDAILPEGTALEIATALRAAVREERPDRLADWVQDIQEDVLVHRMILMSLRDVLVDGLLPHPDDAADAETPQPESAVAPSVAPVAGTPSEREVHVDAEQFDGAPPEGVIPFLMGAGTLDGCWFGERPGGKAPFWWRAALEAEVARLAALRTAEPAPELEPETCSRCGKECFEKIENVCDNCWDEHRAAPPSGAPEGWSEEERRVLVAALIRQIDIATARGMGLPVAERLLARLSRSAPPVAPEENDDARASRSTDGGAGGRAGVAVEDVRPVAPPPVPAWEELRRTVEQWQAAADPGINPMRWLPSDFETAAMAKAYRRVLALMHHLTVPASPGGEVEKCGHRNTVFGRPVFCDRRSGHGGHHSVGKVGDDTVIEWGEGASPGGEP